MAQDGQEPEEAGSQQLDVPAYETFAREVAANKSYAEAYRLAGYADDRRHAYRLWATNGDIQARAAYLRKEAGIAFGLEQAEALQILANIARNVSGDVECKDSITALKLAGAWCGWEKGTEADNKTADVLKDMMAAIILRNDSGPR